MEVTRNFEKGMQLTIPITGSEMEDAYEKFLWDRMKSIVNSGWSRFYLSHAKVFERDFTDDDKRQLFWKMIEMYDVRRLDAMWEVAEGLIEERMKEKYPDKDFGTVNELVRKKGIIDYE